MARTVAAAPPRPRAPEAAMIHDPGRVRILFVCAGNLCRSPTAEVVFRHEAWQAGLARRFLIDSAGTLPWYVGNPPDYRAVEHASRRGYDLSPLRARQVAAADFAQFQWILAMDGVVLADLHAMRPAGWAGRLALFLEVASAEGPREVADPYDRGPAAFERMLDQIEGGCRRLVRFFAGTPDAPA